MSDGVALAWVHLYPGTVFAWFLLGVLACVQLLIAELPRWRRGSLPGAAVESGAGEPCINAANTLRGMYDLLGVFLLLTLVVMATGAHPVPVNGFALLFAVSQIGHWAGGWGKREAVCTICRVLSTVALLGLVIIAALAL